MTSTDRPAIDQQAIVSLLSDLINIPSVTGSERNIAEFVVDYMQKAGLEAWLQDVEDGRANAIGRLRGSGGGPALLFTGHLDTATSGRPQEDYAGLGELGPGHYARAYTKAGHVYGLGAGNMKGGVAAAITAVASLAKSAPLKGDVILAWVAGESENAPVDGLHRPFQGARYRGGGIGTRYFVTHGPPAESVVVCEPSNLYVTNVDAGYLFVKLIVKMPRSGGDAHRGGANLAGPASGAISILTHVVQAIEAWQPEYLARHKFPTGFGTMEPSIGVGAIESGWPFKPTYKPPVGNIYLTLRLTPAMEPSTPLRELREILDAVGARTVAFDYDLEVYGSNFPSAITESSHPLVQTALRARERVLGSKPNAVPSRYYRTWNDTNIFRQHGIPAVILGPSFDDTDLTAGYDAGQHVAIEQLHAAAQMYVLIARDLCG